MFNTTRNHRWVTIPAAIAVLLAMVTSEANFLFFAPPVFALPFIVHAASRRTEAATAAALITLRVAGGLLVVAGLIGAPDNALLGLMIVGAGTVLLVATGTHRRECRLAAATSVTGGLVLLASPLTAWIGADLRLTAGGAVGLLVGGVVWAREVLADARTREVIPAMKIAA